MPVLAHAPCKEKINASLQGPRACARIVHPLWMPGKNGPSLSLTFFVIFRHADIIGSQAVHFNTKMAVTYGNACTALFRPQCCQRRDRPFLKSPYIGEVSSDTLKEGGATHYLS